MRLDDAALDVLIREARTYHGFDGRPVSESVIGAWAAVRAESPVDKSPVLPQAVKDDETKSATSAKANLRRIGASMKTNWRFPQGAASIALRDRRSGWRRGVQQSPDIHGRVNAALHFTHLLEL